VGLSRYHIFNSVDQSLQRLQLDHIDILYVHGVDPKTELEEIVRSLNDIVNTGKVRYIAICNWPAWMVVQAQTIAHYNRWHELVPMAANQHLAIFPWSPLAGSFLTGKFTREGGTAGARREAFDFPPIDKEKAYNTVDVMKEIGKQYKATPAQVALAWVRQQPGITSTIIGAKTVEQVNANIQSTDVVLTADDLKKIDAVSPLPAQYPGWMVKRQGSARD
jgi:aryl-alcohol dehydrogenase-like predicted oxidoreductase